VGYRWFDKQNIQPLFPFGFGLTYTSFQYSQLEVAHAADGGVDVRFSIANTGHVASDEVPQVYLGPPAQQPAGVQFAVRSLISFDRVHINPGQSTIVRLHVPPRCLQYWSVSDNRWIADAGARTLYVGPSSRNLPLQSQLPR
jgi:beta-glucosidase